MLSLARYYLDHIILKLYSEELSSQVLTLHSAVVTLYKVILYTNLCSFIWNCWLTQATIPRFSLVG
jgi:hypothetical protein